jgi:5-formyltetrahydrofolate cyclo-ligase
MCHNNVQVTGSASTDSRGHRAYLVRHQLLVQVVSQRHLPHQERDMPLDMIVYELACTQQQAGTKCVTS